VSLLVAVVAGEQSAFVRRIHGANRRGNLWRRRGGEAKKMEGRRKRGAVVEEEVEEELGELRTVGERYCERRRAVSSELALRGKPSLAVSFARDRLLLVLIA